MNWSEYSERFATAAREYGYDNAYIERCLTYARPLAESGLPVIFDAQHLAMLVGYRMEYLRGVAYAAPRFYRRFTVPKRRGGTREIREPLPSLKEIQRWILDSILHRRDVSRYAKGFVPKRSTLDNARFHRRQRQVLSLDLKDFFPSIGRGRVYVVFRRFGYASSVADLLSRICTLEERLPQGAPTSPALSNLIATKLDKRLGALALKCSLRYTRYADDLTFSGEAIPGRLIFLVQKIVAEEGFSVNTSKTRLMEPHQRQEVTGVVVNAGMSAPRDMRRKLRQECYFIQKHGLEEHLARRGEMRANYLRHLMGIANYIVFVNGRDAEAKKYLAMLHELLRSEQLTGMD